MVDPTPHPPVGPATGEAVDGMLKAGPPVFTLSVTNRCPLSCAHCGPRSGPEESGTIARDVVVDMLNNASSRGCKLVNLAGGEPFILGEYLEDIVRLVVERDMAPRITTGAYWAKTTEAASARLEPLVAAGLRELAISHSVHHGKFVRLTSIINAARAARENKLRVFLNITSTRSSQGLIPAIRRAFEAAGEVLPYIRRAPVIPFGRASETIEPGDFLLSADEQFAGPCASAGRSLTLHPTGAITGCAVVFGAECAPLVGGYTGEEPVGAILDRIDNEPLYAFIHKVGVVELKNFIEEHSDLRFPNQHVNICHLCGELLSDERVVAFLRQSGLFLGDSRGSELTQIQGVGA